MKGNIFIGFGDWDVGIFESSLFCLLYVFHALKNQRYIGQMIVQIPNGPVSIISGLYISLTSREFPVPIPHVSRFKCHISPNFFEYIPKSATVRLLDCILHIVLIYKYLPVLI